MRTGNCPGLSQKLKRAAQTISSGVGLGGSPTLSVRVALAFYGGVMVLAEEYRAKAGQPVEDVWCSLSDAAASVLRQLHCVSRVEDSQQNSAGKRPANELADTRSVMELALNRDIAFHGFA